MFLSMSIDGIEVASQGIRVTIYVEECLITVIHDAVLAGQREGHEFCERDRSLELEESIVILDSGEDGAVLELLGISP